MKIKNIIRDIKQLYITMHGVFLLFRKNYDLAIMYFQKAAIICPCSSTYNNLGAVYILKQDYDKGIYYLIHSLKYNPFYEIARENLSRAKLLYNLMKRSQLKSDDYKYHLNKSLSYFCFNDYKRTLIELAQAIKLEPKNNEAYIIRSIVYLQKNNFEQALVNANIAIKLDSKDFLAYFNQGLVYEEKSDFIESIFSYTKTIELQPDFDLAYFNRGMVYSKLNDKEKLKKDLQKVLEISKDVKLREVVEKALKRL
ncbi:TPR repeat-containing protein [Candidatus Fervidibacteria bacterium JGI MDM2 SSWTFF-3-K9]